jgi:uncharacterized membrane protein
MRTKPRLRTTFGRLIAALMMSAIVATGSAVAAFGATAAVGSNTQTRAGSDQAFLQGIHRAGIIAPDQQAIETANQVARMDSSNASGEEIGSVIRNFGIYDNHIDAFAAAAIAAYGQYGQDGAFLQGIHRAGIIAPDQQAIETANQVARMDSSNASSEEMSNVIHNFGIYDNHIDAFEAAAIAAYEL